MEYSAVPETSGEKSAFTKPPMLPLIASDSKFINSTVEHLDALNYANNPAVRANLLDAIKCWLSHIDEVLGRYNKHEAEWDKIASHATQASFPLAITADAEHLDPRQVLFELRSLETDLNFHDQFNSLPLLACLRVLKQIREAAGLLATLETKLQSLRAHQAHIITDIMYMQTVAEYFYLFAAPKARPYSWPDALAVIKPIHFPEERRKTVSQFNQLAPERKSSAVSTTKASSSPVNETSGGSGSPTSGTKRATSLVAVKANPTVISDVWQTPDLPDMLAPLFSSLRALWVCSERFGAKAARRFSSITRFTIHQVELSVHSEAWDSILRVIDNATAANMTKVKEGLVYSQESIVALQECFYNLKAHMSEGGSDGINLVYNDLNDEVVFSNTEWQYRRLTNILQIVDNLRNHSEKIGSKLTDPFDLHTAEGDVLSRSHFPDHRFDACAKALLNQNAPDPDEIIRNIVNKESERQKALKDREPRYPLALLTSHMSIVCSFSPPTVTITGGPLSHTAMDAAQSKLPSCCANKIPDGKQTKMKMETVFNKVKNPADQSVYRLVIPAQYCETSLHVVMFVHTLLTIVEAELCWNLCGTHSLIDPDFGETHYFIFKKVDPTARKQATAAGSDLAIAKAKLAQLEGESS